MKDLLNELCGITYWFRFGANLNLSKDRLLQIKYDYRDSPTCIQEVIMEWRQQEEPMWSKAVIALHASGYVNKAKELAKKYGV